MTTEQEAGEVATIADGGPAAEIASIEQTMASEPWAYWNDQAKQDRYRQLLTAREAKPKPAPVEATPAVNLGSLADAEANGLDGDTFMARHRLASTVLIHLAPADATALADAFDALPDHVALPALDAVANARVVAPTASTPEQVANFAADPAGAELVREWGEDAPMRCAIASARYSSAFEQIPHTDWGRLQDFFWGLPQAPRKALLRRLAE